MTALTFADWQQRARDLHIEGRAFIQGEYSASAAGADFDCISPVDGRVLAQVASCDEADADRAVLSARMAFESGAWSRLAPAKRKAVMIRFADLLEANAQELALLETLDMGKPISDALAVDVPGAARALRWSGEAIDKIYDEVAATPHDQLGLVTREPVGVVAAIVPWNFPLMMACWKLGPALATGNSVVLKPSEKSPLSAIRMAQLAIEAGIPPGVLNVFNQGEVCTAGSRLLVEGSIKARFLPMVVEALKGWKPGNPLDPATNVGALVDTQQLDTVLGYIEAGRNDGAQVLIGGQRTLEESGGLYVEPTIFDGVSNAMKIAQEEIFGPVLSVITFDTPQEAVTIANDTPYGLAAAVWTADLSKAHLTARALRAGSVWVNQYDGGDMTAPFGGFKQSGNGRDKSLHAFDKYTELKATWIKL